MGAMLVGIDTGGTFTDFVVLQGGGMRVHKVLSTPDDPARAILKGLRDLGLRHAPALFVHGSTVATNAVLERKGARTALITTAGFRDVLEIGRQNRARLYDLEVRKAQPLVPRELRFEVPERLDERGRVLLPLDRQVVKGIAGRLAGAGVESVAVCLLFSFTNPEHEQAVAEALEPVGAFISASHRVLPEFREYERTSTVVLNAYVAPVVGRYLERLEASLAPGARLRVMQSNGGSISAGRARREAARTLLSGPAGGVVGAAFVARASGLERVISFDMGGTSTDVSLVDGAVGETVDGAVAGFPCRLPMIDIHTIGAGGGSLAGVDLGGALRVGPQSAGADPGPAAYGRGGPEPTVTDANVVLGRLPPEAVLGGELALDVRAARQALADLGRGLGMAAEEAALGILQVVNANMEGAVRVISVERGHDPRRFTLVAFGGAGPLHACELAARLGIPRVLVPRAPGVLSALGMLAADVVKDYVRTVMVGPGGDWTRVERVAAELVALGRAEMEGEAVAPGSLRLERYVDLRYRGQSYELTVPLDGAAQGVLRAFHEAHQRRFGHADPGEPVEVVNVRVKAIGRAEAPRLRPEEPEPRAEPEPVAVRPVVFSSGRGRLERLETPIYDRRELRPGAALKGPAVITQLDATTLLPPGWEARLDALGHLVARPGGGA